MQDRTTFNIMKATTAMQTLVIEVASGDYDKAQMLRALAVVGDAINMSFLTLKKEITNG